MYNLGRKISTRKCNSTKFCAQGDKKFKGSGDLSTRPFPEKLTSCEKELKESLNRKEKHQPQKGDTNVIEGGRPRFQLQQAEELDCFGHMVLALESKIQKMGYGTFLIDMESL